MVGFQLVGTVHCPVHGHIGLTREEMEIIDHPLFRRLRRVLQTGVLAEIFPGATQTRFIHSIGVAHLVGSLLEALEEQSKKAGRRSASFRKPVSGVGVRYDQVPQKVRDQIRRLARICGLVHDLGHGPLSHGFEPLYPTAVDFARVLADERLAVLEPYRAELLKGAHGLVTHEALSVVLFACLWRDSGGDVEVSRVVAAVLLHTDPIGVSPEIVPWITLIQDLICSAPVDADRMDYLLRDSMAMGVPYGLYALDRLLKSVQCVRNPNGTDTYRLGWRESGLPTVIDFLLRRRSLFEQIYAHKTNRAIEFMLEGMGQAVRRLGLAIIDMTSLDAFLRSFSLLGDEYFLLLMSGEIRADFPGENEAKRLAQNLRDRRFWKRIVDCRSKVEANAVALELKRHFPGSTFLVDVRPLRVCRDFEHAQPLLELREGKYQARSWQGASNLLDTLMHLNEVWHRVYLAECPESEALLAMHQAVTKILATLRA